MTDPRRTRSPETWDKARADYLAGHTAERVCARYDLGISAFYKRARQEGWRRADQPDPEPVDDDSDTLPDADPEAAAELALRRMAACVQRGRASEALRWQRLYASLSDRLQAEAILVETHRRREKYRREDIARETRVRASLPPNATLKDYIRAHIAELNTIPPFTPPEV